MQRELSIAEELGDRGGVTRASGNMGIVYWRRGEFDRALECMQRQLSIAEELGHRASVLNSIGSMGIVYRDLGEYDRALECYQQQRSMAKELGDPRGAGFAIGNMASVYTDLGEYDRALECVDSALREHREIGLRYGISYWLAGRADLLLECVQQQASRADARIMPAYLPKYIPGAERETWQVISLRMVREDAEECLAISKEISNPETLFISNLILARLNAAEGDTQGATKRLRAMLAEAGDDEQRVELHYWLWKLIGGDHRTEALQLYRILAEKTPKHEYSKRIEELTATPSTEATNAPE
jgi:tetratricopeptide (TPR) repeat protein